MEPCRLTWIHGLVSLCAQHTRKLALSNEERRGPRDHGLLLLIPDPEAQRVVHVLGRAHVCNKYVQRLSRLEISKRRFESDCSCWNRDFEFRGFTATCLRTQEGRQKKKTKRASASFLIEWLSAQLSYRCLWGCLRPLTQQPCRREALLYIWPSTIRNILPLILFPAMFSTCSPQFSSPW